MLDGKTIATVNTSEIQSLANGFLARSAEVRRVVANAIQGAPEVASAVIMAGQFAIEDAMTEVDKAFIKKGVDRGKILVEGGKTPPDDKIFAVIAEAESKHLDLGTRQYSIWSNGTLYIKEEGFRRLFALRTDCSELDTDIKPPVWMKLQERSCWHVPVKASVNVRGRGKVFVECTVGVNGNMTDTIAKVEAHAERSVLKKLWKKVTSIVIDDGDENDVVASVVVVQDPAAKIENQMTDLQRDRKAAEDNLHRAFEMMEDNADHSEFVRRSIEGINEADSVELLKEVGKLMAEERKRLKISEKVMEFLRRLYLVREREIGSKE